MTKAILFINILLLVTLGALGQNGNKTTRDAIRTRVKYGKAIKQNSYNLKLNTVDTSRTFSDFTATNKKRNALLENKFDMVHRRATYSVSSGYRCPGGTISLKFEDRFIPLNTHLQPGISVGFSPISGLRLSGGLTCFLIGEKHKYMPLINAQYIFSSGNRLASTIKADSFYCITGKGKYLNLSAGMKLKPWARKNEIASQRPEISELLNFKVLVGYSFLLQHPGIDSLPQPQNGWDFKMNTIREHLSSGLFLEVNFGIDIPYIRETKVELAEEADLKN